MERIEERTGPEIAANRRIYNRADSDHKKVLPRDWEAKPEQWAEAHNRIQRALAKQKAKGEK